MKFEYHLRSKENQRLYLQWVLKLYVREWLLYNKNFWSMVLKAWSLSVGESNTQRIILNTLNYMVYDLVKSMIDKKEIFPDVNAHGWWTADGLQRTNGRTRWHVWSEYGTLWWYGHVPSSWTTLPKSVSFISILIYNNHW